MEVYADGQSCGIAGVESRWRDDLHRRRIRLDCQRTNHRDPQEWRTSEVGYRALARRGELLARGQPQRHDLRWMFGRESPGPESRDRRLVLGIRCPWFHHE